MRHIRNFSIIAHIDHGKSTLADCFIRRCGGIPEREMTEQVLDTMDLERERGITIKAQTAALRYRPSAAGDEHLLNLIDTPGHVDFSYEVSRALAACEGALLVVDAAQGVEAQTVANCGAAIALGLEIIPVINKIDLPAAEPERVAREIREIIGVDGEPLSVSAKTGEGVEALLRAIVERIPPPSGDPQAPLRALVVDSWFDNYLGAVMLARVMDGALRRGTRIRMMGGGGEFGADRMGVFTPRAQSCAALTAGEVGYVVAGVKRVADTRVGDTITAADSPAAEALPGFTQVKPRVFASLYPISSADFRALREALEKLRLNDAALVFTPEQSPALGPGMRCGFLGMLHLEIVQERLEREYGANLIVAAPGVAYQLLLKSGETVFVDNPGKMPSPEAMTEIREPFAQAVTIVPAAHLGAVMELVATARGAQTRLDYAGGQALLYFDIPLAELITGFFAELKSVSRGRASLDYDFAGWRKAAIVKLDILVGGERVDALATMTPKAAARRRGREIVAKIKQLVPRQMFDVAVQAAIGGEIIARETVKALKKNVLAKCYGGDVTRKRKLIEKQKAGKKRMKQLGKVEIPQAAFLAVLRGGGDGR